MRQKIASAFVVSFCLLLIAGAFFGSSFNIAIKACMVVVAVFLLLIVHLSSRKDKNNREIRKIKADSQKVIEDNIDWLRSRWARIQDEKDSGLLTTVSEWYFDDATDMQLSQIERIGFNLGATRITKGQASDIIGLYKPGEDKNIAILQNHNIPLERLNQTKARELVLNLRKNHMESATGIIHVSEHMIIKQLTDDFIYFVRFFDSRVRYHATLPEYIAKDDRLRIRYEQAAQLGLARRGAEISLEEKLKSLPLEQLSSLAGGQIFSDKAPAIEILLDIPDIDDRFESMSPKEDWFQLRPTKLDVTYLETKWSKLYGENY